MCRDNPSVKMHRQSNVGAATSLVTPARHHRKSRNSWQIKGAHIMLFDTIPKDSLWAMVIAVVATAVVILAINYLAEYRDWKFEKQIEYEAALNSEGKDAVKPVLNFSWLYAVAIVASFAIVSVVAVFIVPLAVKFFVYDPELAVEPATYFFIAVVVTACLALFFDKKIARPAIDSIFKARESAAEDIVIADLEKKFQAGAVAGLSQEAQVKLMAAIAEALKSQKP